MQGKMIDIVEDIGKGLNTEQLAPKPATKGEEKDGTERTSTGKNA
jgi:hypothetical protein